VLSVLQVESHNHHQTITMVRSGEVSVIVALQSWLMLRDVRLPMMQYRSQRLQSSYLPLSMVGTMPVQPACFANKLPPIRLLGFETKNDRIRVSLISCGSSAGMCRTLLASLQSRKTGALLLALAEPALQPTLSLSVCAGLRLLDLLHGWWWCRVGCIKFDRNSWWGGLLWWRWSWAVGVLLTVEIVAILHAIWLVVSIRRDWAGLYIVVCSVIAVFFWLAQLVESIKGTVLRTGVCRLAVLIWTGCRSIIR